MNMTNVLKRAASLSIVTGLVFSLSAPGALAQSQTQMPHSNMYMMEQQTGITGQQQTHVIPAGTSLTVRPATWAPNNVGENFTGHVVNPVMVNGVTVIPSGSQIHGTVVGMNPNLNTMDIQFREVNTTTGDVIPIRARANVNRLQGAVQQQQVVTPVGGGTTLFPRVTWGPGEGMTPGGKIAAGTVGGALFGGATGALTGLVFPSVYENDVEFNEGTGAVRGLAWGAAFGAGLGLLSGLVAAAGDRDNVAVTTTSMRRPQGAAITNISTGSLEEIPVAYSTTSTTTTGIGTTVTPDFVIILEQPATVSM